LGKRGNRPKKNCGSRGFKNGNSGNKKKSRPLRRLFPEKSNK
jgi:hypothetical protein